MPELHLPGCNQAGKPVIRHKLKRSQLVRFIADLAVPQAVHRARERLVSERTAAINQIRGFPIQYGRRPCFIASEPGRRKSALTVAGLQCNSPRIAEKTRWAVPFTFIRQHA